MLRPTLLASGALAALTLSACSGGGSAGVDPEAARQSAELTDQAVGGFLTGDSDRDQALADLRSARETDPWNHDARLMLALIEFLDFLGDELQATEKGSLGDLLNRAGVKITVSAGYQVGVELPDYGQGTFRDSMPELREFESWLRERLAPATEALVAVFESAPGGWSYLVAAEDAGFLGEMLSPGEALPLRFDQGDSQAVAALGRLVLAVSRLPSVWDLDSMSLNDLDREDDPDLDLLVLLRSHFPLFGRLVRPAALGAVRFDLVRAFDAYQRAILHIRAETGVDRDQGVLSPAHFFATQDEADDFLATESAIRGWLSGIVDRIDARGIYQLADLPGPLPLPPEQRLSVDFSRVFAGFSLRDYMMTLPDPLTLGATLLLGNSDFVNLTPQLASFHGCLVDVAGHAPQGGDLQELLGYGLLYGFLPAETKTIDGGFDDWVALRQKVSSPGRARLGEIRPEMGSLWAAKDVDHLYLYHDVDLTQVLTGDADEYQITVRWTDGVEAYLRYRASVGLFTTWSSDASHSPIYARATGRGIEMAFPRTGAVWADVGLRVMADNAGYQVDLDLNRMYVNLIAGST